MPVALLNSVDEWECCMYVQSRRRTEDIYVGKERRTEEEETEVVKSKLIVNAESTRVVEQLAMLLTITDGEPAVCSTAAVVVVSPPPPAARHHHEHTPPVTTTMVGTDNGGRRTIITPTTKWG